MLRRQQARATIAARRKIVQGAVEIAYGAADELIDRGISMSVEERNKMVSNLLLVITGDNSDGNAGGLQAASLESQHGHMRSYGGMPMFM
jgi:predicted RNA-binding protein with PIN domain